MPNTIVFEELDTAPPESLEALSELVLSGAGLIAPAEDIAFGFGEISVTQANVGTSIEDVELIISFGELPFAAAYSFIMEVDEVEAFGEIPLAGAGTTEPSLILGFGELGLAGTAVIGLEAIPVGDGLVQEVQEGIFMESQSTSDMVLSVVASVLGQTSVLTTLSAMASRTEQLSFATQLRLLFEAAVAEGVDFTAGALADRIATVAALDALEISGQATSLLSAVAMLADAIALAEAATSVQETDVADAAALADTLETKLLAIADVISEIVVDAAAQGLAVVSVLVDEQLVAGDELTMQAIYTAAANEQVTLALSVAFDGVPYLGLSMNAETKGVTEYDNYNFSGLAEFNGTLYGVGEAGLYKLEGDDDAGAEISASLRTALLRLGAGKETRIDSAYLGYRSNGTLQLKVTYIDSRGSKRSYVYDLQELPARDNRPGRVKVGKGLKSVYWSFELSNTDGADFDLDVLEILPLAFTRRLL